MNYCRTFCEQRLWIRKRYPEKFFWIDEGMTVRWGNLLRQRGVITKMDYFPSSDTYLIEVNQGNQNTYFTDPEKLERIDAE